MPNNSIIILNAQLSCYVLDSINGNYILKAKSLWSMIICLMRWKLTKPLQQNSSFSVSLKIVLHTPSNIRPTLVSESFIIQMNQK